MNHESRIKNKAESPSTPFFSIHNSLFFIRNSPRGMSLLEVLIVIAIVAVIAAAGAGMYRSFGKNVELTSIAQTISADLRHMQGKAMTGEGGLKWGARFWNSTDDYYELFSTPTTYSDGSRIVNATTTLSKGITFASPTEGDFTDVIFNKISGTTTATTVIISSEGATQTVTISGVGAIY